MKKAIFLFALLGSLAATAQKKAADPNLSTRLQQYGQLTLSHQYDKLIDYIYPRTFELVPREMLVDAMTAMFADTSILKVSIDTAYVIGYHSPYKYKGGIYQKLDYVTKMSMVYTDSSADSLTNLTLGLFQLKYGEANASYNPDTRAYQIKTTESMLAIRDSYSPEWTLLRIAQSEACNLLPRKVAKKMCRHIKPTDQE